MLKTAPEHVNELEFHPAANIFPMMTAKDLEELATDIELNGQREPCVLIDGKVIDGRRETAFVHARCVALNQIWPI